MEEEKVLCVSMEESVLETCRPAVPRDVRIEMAVGPEQGLAALEDTGAYGALVADFDMEDMDGLEFLGRAWSLSPDTIRVLLFGSKGIRDAVNALNEDVIFHFLPKPCTVARLTWAIDAAIAQCRLLTSERQLSSSKPWQAASRCSQTFSVWSIPKPSGYAHSAIRTPYGSRT